MAYSTMVYIKLICLQEWNAGVLIYTWDTVAIFGEDI